MISCPFCGRTFTVGGGVFVTPTGKASDIELLFSIVSLNRFTSSTVATTVYHPLTNVTDTFGQTMPDTAVTIRFLIGDTTGSGSVNAGDAIQTRSLAGQATDTTNFRSDVNTDGFVNTGDTLIVRTRAGSSVP